MDDAWAELRSHDLAGPVNGVPCEGPRQRLVDQLLDQALEDTSDGLPSHLWERALLGPAREFLRRPGKRFRARLVEISWLLAGGPADRLPPQLPLIVEVLHAGSLIIDDIEDRAATRRDAPALHHMVGVPLALNTGNWLYFWPVTLLEEVPLDPPRRAELRRRINVTLLRSHRGQALDLALRVTELDQREIPPVVRTATQLKTGTLMALAAALGGVAAGADHIRLRALCQFATELGVGLQMLDDLGSIASPSRTDKRLEDLTNGRPTWPWAWLASSASPTRFADYQRRARDVMNGIRPPGELAGALCDAIGESGRQRATATLQRALTALHARFGPSPTIDQVREEVTRLERSYG